MNAESMGRSARSRVAVSPNLVKRLLLLLVVAALLLPAQLNPSHFFQDDSYFYLQVASHLASGHGSTFHTITPTNGYHPLWMVLCALAFFLAAGSKSVALQLVVAMQALLALGTIIYFRRLTALLSAPFWPVGASFLGAFFLTTAIFGSEAHLNAFLLMAGTYQLAVAGTGESGARRVAAGIILGLAILARLDNVFVVGWLILLTSLGAGPLDLRGTLRRGLRVGLPVAVVLLPYLVYNHLQFGHFMPISGAIKSSFPNVTWDPDSLGRLGKVSLFAGLASLAIAPLTSKRLNGIILASLGAGVVTHGLYVMLFTEHYTFWPWYYVSGVINMAVLGVVTLDTLKRRVSIQSVTAAIPTLAIAGTVLIVVLGVSYGWTKAYPTLGVGSFRPGRALNTYRWTDEVSRWMDENLPADGGVLVYDFPGTLAYYSDLRILPTDGLINDYSYGEDIVREGIARYMCESEVGWYFGPVFRGETSIGPGKELEILGLPSGGQRIRIKAPLSGALAGSIAVPDEELVVRIRDVVRAPERTPDLGIWRVDACRQADAEIVR